MNILISVNSEYLEKAETMLFSLALHTKEENDIYLINNELSDEQVKKLEHFLSKRCNSRLIAIKPDKSFFEEMPLTEWFSVEMYNRILAQSLLPSELDRILWLDADIIIMDDITDFYYQDFNDKCIVATPDIKYDGKLCRGICASLGLEASHKYFNSGVLLFNLNKIRSTVTEQQILSVCMKLKDKLKYPDQDILNYLYQDKVKYCESFNYNYQLTDISSIKKADEKSIKILHYSGKIKPWKFRCINKASKYYWRVQIRKGNLLDCICVYSKFFLRKVYKKIKQR